MAGVGCQSKQLPCVHNPLDEHGEDEQDGDEDDDEDDEE